jgi:prepilin-type N-terminal cleavage/methylation domain-containing protein
MPKPPRSDREAGFTLIELAVAMILFGIVVAIAVGPYMRYNRAQQQRGIARRVVATLRSAQVSSVSENAVYRVDFTASSVTVFRKDTPTGSTWSQTAKMSETESTIDIGSPQFVLPTGETSTSCYFYPRGIASATTASGGIVITRSDSDQEYTITVEGLTARVSYDD